MEPSHRQAQSARFRPADVVTPMLAGLLFATGVLSGADAASSVPAQTIITVNTANDELNNDGDCSLREAVVAANTDSARDACPPGSGRDTLILPAGTYTLTRAGTGEDAAATGDLDITSAMIISGAGPANTIIDGNALDRVLQVVSTAPVDIQGVTLQHGRPPAGVYGGGVYLNSGSQVTFTASLVRDNAAVGPGLSYGGGFYNASTSKLVLVNSSVSGNHVQSLSGSGYTTFGGGIHNSGSLALYDSVVSGNTLTTTAQGEGAGINNGGTLTLQSSTVKENMAGSGGSGGGLVNNGAATIITSEILSNTAPVYGAGIRSSGSLVVVDSRVSGNLGPFGILVTGGTTSVANSRLGDNSGSGLLVVHGQVTVTNSLVDGNHSGLENFSGVLAVSDSTIAANNSGIGTAYGRTNILRSTIAANAAVGVDNYGGTMRIVNSTISGNGSGGVGNSYTGTTTLTNTTVMSNSLSGLFNYSSAYDGSAGTLILTNSVVGGTHDSDAPMADCSGPLTSGGYNLIQNAGDCPIAGDTTGNLLGTDPQVGPLQDNGGWTYTHALLPGSPAIDAGQAATCQLRDQRGLFRPADGDGLGGNECDMGAFELNGLVPLQLFVPLMRR